MDIKLLIMISPGCIREMYVNILCVMFPFVFNVHNTNDSIQSEILVSRIFYILILSFYRKLCDLANIFANLWDHFDAILFANNILLPRIYIFTALVVWFVLKIVNTFI